MKRERESKKKKKLHSMLLESLFLRSIEPRRAFFSFVFPQRNPKPPSLKNNNRCTFVVEGFTYNYVVDGSFTFLAVSAER